MIAKFKVLTGVFYCTCVILCSSCLKSTTYSDEAQMLTFSLSNFPDSTYTFVIDENTKTISNQASPLPFETNLVGLIPIFTASASAFVYAKDSIYIDSAQYTVQASGFTSNDFSGSVEYNVLSQSGAVNNTYYVNVSTSEVNPDELILEEKTSAIGGSMDVQNLVWFNNEMWYFSSDLTGGNSKVLTSNDLGTTWQEKAITMSASSPFKVNVLNDTLYLVDESGTYVSDGTTSFISTGYIGKPNPVLLRDEDDNEIVAISTANGDISYAKSSSDWSESSNISLILLKAGSCYFKGKLYLVSGDSIYFSDKANAKWSSLPSPENLTDPVIFSYNQKLFILGGVNANGATTRNVYVSRDGGLSWLKDTRPNFVLPAGYTRAGAQAAIDNDGNLWLVGGYSQDIGGTNYTQHSDVLVGKMNVLNN